MHYNAQQLTVGSMLARADQRSVGQLADMRFAVPIGLIAFLAASGGTLAAYPLPSGYRYPDPPGSAFSVAVRQMLRRRKVTFEHHAWRSCAAFHACAWL